MKKLIATAALCFAAAAASAQQKADIVVSYDVVSRHWETDTVVSERMTLLANSSQAKYFNDISLWNDSLSSTPEGARRLKEIIFAACATRNPDGSMSFDSRKGPGKKIYTYVFSDLPKGSLRYYDYFAENMGYYDEPADEMQWEIGDIQTDVLGYECIEATTDYHGRKWTAWFTPDIPLPFGPWKFRGLPGLILKATADNGMSFTASGIEKCERVMTPIYSPEKYEKVNRKKALADKEYYIDNVEAILKARFGDNVQFDDSGIDRPKYDALKYAIEPDYKKSK